MARSDLLISLVRAGSAGDVRGFRTATEAIIAEERSKRHDVLAERLAKAIQTNGNGAHSLSVAPTADGGHRGREFVFEVTPRRQLEELVLTDSAKRSIQQLIEEQLRADVLRSHGIEPRHRALFVGAPGTGKTTLAEAVAESLSVPLFVVRYEAMIGSFLGETASRLKRLFDYTRTIPCVLFFDEFDAIGKERGDTHETGEIKRVVTSLLMQIDQLPSYTVIIAATNHPELLDRAAWRRFQLKLDLPLPGQKQLTAYIQNFSKIFEEPLGQSPAAIAKALGGISYAEAEDFCRDVRRRQILAMGEASLKRVLSEQLHLWTAQPRGKSSLTVRSRNAGTSAPGSSRT